MSIFSSVYALPLAAALLFGTGSSALAATPQAPASQDAGSTPAPKAPKSHSKKAAKGTKAKKATKGKKAHPKGKKTAKAPKTAKHPKAKKAPKAPRLPRPTSGGMPGQ